MSRTLNPQRTSRPVGRPAETDSDETRHAVLQSATRMFARRGYGRTTLRAIADDAGLTHGTVYHHFRTKRQIFLAVEQDITARVHTALREAFESDSTFEGKWSAVLRAAMNFVESDSALAEFIATLRTEARRHPELAEAGHDRRWLSLYADLTSAAIADGYVEARDGTLANLTIATTLAGLIQMSVDTEFEYYRLAVEACIVTFPAGLRALSPRSASGPAARRGRPRSGPPASTSAGA